MGNVNNVKAQKKKRKLKEQKSRTIPTPQNKNIIPNIEPVKIISQTQALPTNVQINTESKPLIDIIHPAQLSFHTVKVRALYTYVTQNVDDLPFTKGDILMVDCNLNESWWYAKHTISLKMGYIPQKYVVIDDGTPYSLDGWFDINQAETYKKLLLPGYPEGTYIIRPSVDTRHWFLSIRHFDTLKNDFVVIDYMITSSDQGDYFINEDNSFMDMNTLILFYNSHTSGLCCCLANPFPRLHKPALQFREFEVNRNLITFVKTLGKGSFGNVYLAKWSKSVEVAMKMLKQTNNDQDQRAFLLYYTKLMQQLHHPHVMELLGICCEPNNKTVYILIEFMRNGSLLNFLRQDDGQKVFLKDMFLMMNQITDGMEYLESKNIIHGHLRAANVLVSEDNTLKVGDFGLTKLTENINKNDPGWKLSIKWTAPEVANNQTFSVKSDVWSFGVLLYEIVTYGKTPYAGLEPDYILSEIEKGYRLPNPRGEKINCPEKLYDIMLFCWKAKPEDRPTFSYLKNVFEDYAISTEGHYGLNQ